MTAPKKNFMLQSNLPLKCGKGTVIDKTALFIGKVEIGDGCYIGANTVIGQLSNYDIFETRKSTEAKTKRSIRKTIIGNDVLIQPNVIISNDVIIGNNVWIDPFVTIGAHTRIGQDTRIIYYSQIYENVKIGQNCVIGGFLCDYSNVGNHVSMMGSLLHKYKDGWNDDDDLSNQSPIIEDHAIVGYNSLVIGRVRIRNGTYIAAGAIATKKNIPGNSIVISVNKCIKKDEWSGKLKEGKFFKECGKK